MLGVSVERRLCLLGNHPLNELLLLLAAVPNRCENCLKASMLKENVKQGWRWQGDLNTTESTVARLVSAHEPRRLHLVTAGQNSHTVWKRVV